MGIDSILRAFQYQVVYLQDWTINLKCGRLGFLRSFYGWVPLYGPVKENGDF